MSNLLDHSPENHRFHPSDVVLLRILDHEASAIRMLLVRRHLNHCKECRARYEQLERAVLLVVGYRQYIIGQQPPLSAWRRNLFIKRLEVLLDSAPASQWWRRLLARVQIRPSGNAAPSFRSLALLTCAGLALFTVWYWPLRVTAASDFLNRAVASDSKLTNVGRGVVVRQRVRIRTSKKLFEHAAYRDSSSLRQQKYVKADADEVDLAARIALAGVNWDNPLSAVSFKIWHDRQSTSTDEVHSSGDGFLTLTVRLPLGNLQQESLTVTSDSYHAVEKTIQYRDFGVVDISEVSLNEVNADATDLPVRPLPTSGANVARVPARPSLPDEGELDEAELQTRLILNRHDADTGEQIEIARTQRGIEVTGLVASPGRRRELNEPLREIPFVYPSIKSFDELKTALSSGAQISAIQEQPTAAQVCLLERYFLKNGRDRNDLSRISAGLFDRSLAIRRSSRAIDQIFLRFAGKRELSDEAMGARNELLARNITRLLDDLAEQQRLLAEAAIILEPGAIALSHAGSSDSDLSSLAERNAAAITELISGNNESGRSIESLAAELAETISRLRSAALEVRSDPQALEQP